VQLYSLIDFNEFIENVLLTIQNQIGHRFVSRDVLQCKARYCDCMSSVCPSVCNVGGTGPHRLEILETNCTDN